MEEEQTNSWIDDFIKQQKKQLEEVKRVKDKSNDMLSTNLPESLPQHLNKTNQTIPTQISPSQVSIPSIKLNNKSTIEITQAKYNELTIKLSNKKEKNHALKLQNNALIEENEELKEQLSAIQSKYEGQQSIEAYHKTISQLQDRIKDLEQEKKENYVKCNQMTNIQSQEFDLLNQKIKDFEVIIDENSSNYINNMNKLNKTIEEYKMRITEADKYVNVVNFFIQKINSLYGFEHNDIFDYKELQNKFVDIEKILVSSNLSTKQHICQMQLQQQVPMFQNKILKGISGGRGINNNNNDNSGNNSMHKSFEDKERQREYNEDSKFQEDDLDEYDPDKNKLIFRTLEERVNYLEKEINQRQIPSTMRKSDLKKRTLSSNHLNTNNTQHNPSNKRSISSTRVNNNNTVNNAIQAPQKKIKKKKKKTAGNKVTSGNVTLPNNNSNTVSKIKKNVK